ncbi:hypothetical protein P691DRAFT_768372 [Macrolepiota fuliginosa MF-IS2]|uniref:Uncharacterized protein n=1 Tax=Macrolepiota fuliginosa MF-IS2 TaxID=1400762 RepID=A0A9P6BVZ4_9AGAR|nr:hypothetical protein P691DRAFT_768372 [Macrolepiota fuliginosa MF-IS2]
MSFPKSYANAAAEQHPTCPDKTGLSQYRPLTNPNKAHHPSHVVILFNEPIPADKRRDEATIVSDINSHLTAQGAPPQLKIIAIKWNSQGNCITFTRSDQNAAAIVPFATGLPNVIAPGRQGQIREDKKWFKVEISNV